MRRGALIAGHVVVVAALAAGLFLLVFSADELGGPEVSLNEGTERHGRGPQGTDDRSHRSPAGPASSPESALGAGAAAGAAPGAIGPVGSAPDGPGSGTDEIGPPDAQYTSSVDLLLLRLATSEP